MKRRAISAVAVAACAVLAVVSAPAASAHAIISLGGVDAVAGFHHHFQLRRGHGHLGGRGAGHQRRRK